MSKKSEELFTGQMHAHGAEQSKFVDNRQRDRFIGCATLVSEHLLNATNSMKSGFGIMYDRAPETLADLILAHMGRPPVGANATGYVACRGCLQTAIDQFTEAASVLKELKDMLPEKEST